MRPRRVFIACFTNGHPTVVHDLHEGSPLMMTWNGTGPYNPNIDPITYTEFLELSFHEMQTMTAFGMPGVSTWNFGEAFSHLYLDSVAMNHNSIGRGYETLGNGDGGDLALQAAAFADFHGVVPADASAGGIRLVGAGQFELHGNRGACCAGFCGAQCEGDARNFL